MTPQPPRTLASLATDALLLARPLVFVDLETTGGAPGHDRITEIGVVEIGPGGMSQWSTLVDPQQAIPPFIQQLTGITDAMVRGAPRFENLAATLAERLDGKLFVAHNARFDYGFLKSEFRRAGISFQADVLCTVRLSRALFPGANRHGLDAVVERLRLVPSGRHRALADADLLWQFWQRIHTLHAPDAVNAAVARLTQRGSVSAHIGEDALAAIPACPGVYLFYGDDDAPLYVGKSAQLRRRVAAYFSGETQRAPDLKLAQQVRRIAWRESVGEIGALLAEAHWVDALKPSHNRGRKDAGTVCAWRLAADAITPTLVYASEADFGRETALYGLFQSKRAAEAELRALAAAQQLCPVLLGIEKRAARQACTGLAMGLCAGACVGREPPSAHARRVQAALAPWQLQPWPYAGPIGLRERDDKRRIEGMHVIDNWCYLGTVRSRAELPALLAARGPAARFEAHTYKILNRRILRAGPELEELSACVVPAALAVDG